MPETTIPGGASAPHLRAHLAVPPVGDGPWPGVVVVHEAFGLTDDTREQADRLAAPFAVLERVAGFSYHHPSAEDAWARILRFFDTHLR